MLISVIIPCFNAKKYIDRCLNSFISQLSDDVELIFIDDCSTDGTYEYLKERITKYHNIKLLKNDCNLGPAISRNFGLNKACGKYICFCDADDSVTTNYIITLKKIIIAQEVDMVLFNHCKIIGRRKKIYPSFKTNGLITVEKALVSTPLSFWVVCIKRQIAINNPIPNLKNGEDYATVPVWIKDSSKIFAIKDILYNYYMNSSSVSHEPSYSAMYDIVESSISFCKKKNDSCYEELEFIGIINVLYGATLVGLKSRHKKHTICSLIDTFSEQVPNWDKNKYIKQLPVYKKMYLWCVKKKKILLMRIYCDLHRLLMR